MKLNSYILDDEIHAVEVIRDYIADTKELNLVGFSNNSISGLNEVNQLMPDIAFLDIDMPGLDGLEVCKLINPSVNIILTTASPEFALAAYDLAVFDYLLKPVSYSRFYSCVKRLNNADVRLKNKEDFIFIKCENKGKIVRIRFDDILYMESNTNYVLINTINGKYNTYLTMKEVQAALPAINFFRIHKSFIVNQSKINYIDGNQVVLIDRTVLQLGSTYREVFLNLIHQTIIKTNR